MTPEQLVEEMIEASGFTRLNLLQATSDEEKDEIIEELRQEFNNALTTTAQRVRKKTIEEERKRIIALFPTLNPNSDSWGTTQMERILKEITHPK